MSPKSIQLLLLLALALFVLIPSATVCFYSPDEGRYAEVAREMMVTGDYLTPRLHGVPHLTKPPMAYWGAVLGMRMFGVGPFGARFIPSVLIILTTLCVYELGRRLFDRAVGLRAAIMFSLSPLPFLVGHFLSADIFVTFFQIVAVTSAIAAWEDRKRRFVWGFWLALACAFLSKGPPGLLCLIPVLFMAWRRRGEGRVLWSIPAFVVFLVVSLGWYLLLIAQDGDRATYFLVDEVVNRIFSSSHGRENPLWMYALCLTVGIFPWVFGYWRAARAAKGWYGAPGREVSHRWGVLCIWFFVPLLIFCLSRSRMILYVAPLTVPLLIAFAALIGEPIRFTRRALLTGLAIMVFIAGLNHELRNKGYGKSAPRLAEKARLIDPEQLPVINGTGRRLGCIGLSFQPRGTVRKLKYGDLLDLTSLDDLKRLMGHSRPTWLVIRNKHLPRLPLSPEKGVHEGRLSAYLIQPIKAGTALELR